jgi:hypothetical protein
MKMFTSSALVTVIMAVFAVFVTSGPAALGQQRTCALISAVASTHYGILVNAPYDDTFESVKKVLDADQYVVLRSDKVRGTISAGMKKKYKDVRKFSKVEVSIEIIDSKDTLITVANKPAVPFMDWLQSAVVTDLGCSLRAKHW